MSFTVASYNVLATAYLRAEWYPNTPAALLDPAQRVPALVRHVASLGADVLCLQEVEQSLFAALETSLRPQGYTGWLARKGLGRPDGCATFVRSEVLAATRVDRVAYDDGSGHVAQLVVVERAGRAVAVANTHLKWDPPGTPREAQHGYRQVMQLLARCPARGELPGIVCGDLNATPDSDVVAALCAAGYQSSYAAVERAYTCNSNARAKTIDYVFHSPALRSEPLPLPPVGDHTPLPGDDEPSDHVAVRARIDWRD